MKRLCNILGRKPVKEEKKQKTSRFQRSSLGEAYLKTMKISKEENNMNLIVRK